MCTLRSPPTDRVLGNVFIEKDFSYIIMEIHPTNENKWLFLKNILFWKQVYLSNFYIFVITGLKSLEMDATEDLERFLASHGIQ